MFHLSMLISIYWYINDYSSCYFLFSSFFFLFRVSEAVFYYVASTWPGTYSNPCASACQVLGLQAWTNMVSSPFLSIFCYINPLSHNTFSIMLPSLKHLLTMTVPETVFDCLDNFKEYWSGVLIFKYYFDLN